MTNIKTDLQIDSGNPIFNLYDASWRYYHNRGHIETVKANVHALTIIQDTEPVNYISLETAIDWHDIVYVPGQPGCEHASAQLLLSTNTLYHESARLIELTAEHITEKGDTDGMLLCNADLLGLAINYKTKEIAQELWAFHGLSYLGNIPDDGIHIDSRRYAQQGKYPELEAAWNVGRKKWLEKMIDRKIYAGLNMDKYESRAKNNLELEWMTLDART